MAIITDSQKIKEVLERGVEDVIVKEHLETALRSGKQLRVKFGIDPTSPDLHLGHAVVLRKLKSFQDLGHQIVLIIGDFTATIGDPSGKSKTRLPLSAQEVKRNMKDYLDQAGMIIDIKKSEVRYNSEWLDKLNGVKILEILSLVSLNQILERNDFAKRLQEHQSIRAHELLYPVMQAYDSVITFSDLECGGTDQTFNILMGRTLMERMGKSPQDVLTLPLLEGTDGKEKMSKSLGNYIGITDKPSDMFGKIMSVNDDLILKYFWLCTDVTQDELDEYRKRMEEGANPRDIKMELGKKIVALYHTAASAEKATQEFEKVFSKKELPEQMPEYLAPTDEMALLDVIMNAKLAKSKSDARRVIEQKGVKIGGEVISDPLIIIKATKEGVVIQYGKKNFIKVIKNSA